MKLIRLDATTSSDLVSQCIVLETATFGNDKSTLKVLSGNLKGVIRLVDENCVGGIMYYKHCYREQSKEIYLDTLITDPKFQGKGVATDLLDILTLVGRIFHSRKIWAKVYKNTPTTTQVIKFYTNRNFMVTSPLGYTKKPEIYTVIEHILH